MARADQQLTESPTGASAAEALYLKGRALEQKPIGSQADARNNFSQAREIYQQALAQQPAPPLEARLHAGIANTSYWLDDYATAVTEWSAAYPNFDDPAIKSYMLYRIGLSQQRMGQFGLADQRRSPRFNSNNPGTDAAKRGANIRDSNHSRCSLRLSPAAASADADISKLQQQGVRPDQVASDSHGNTIIAVGPFSSYSQLLAEKLRFSSIYLRQ